MKLSVKALALTSALVWGVGLFLATWWIYLLDGAIYQPTFLSRIYRGYSISPLGSVIGLAWGFVDGLVTGAIFAWLYNRFTGEAGPSTSTQ